MMRAKKFHVHRSSTVQGGGKRRSGSELPGRVTIFYRPVDRFSLRFEGGKDVVAVIFGYIIFDRRTLRPTLGTGLNVDVRHVLLPGYLCCGGSSLCLWSEVET